MFCVVTGYIAGVLLFAEVLLMSQQGAHAAIINHVSASQRLPVTVSPALLVLLPVLLC